MRGIHRLFEILPAALLVLLATGPALAHGGGTVMVPIVIPRPPPALPLPSTGDYASIHTLAVISAIGVSATLERYSHWWGTTDKQINIVDWKIDDDVEARVRAYLGGHYQFKDVTYDRAALAAIPNGRMDESEAALAKYLGALQADGVDAFIVLRPDLEGDVPGPIGLALENNTNENIPPAEWANYQIVVVDAHTLKVIAKAFSRLQVRVGAEPSFPVVIANPDLKFDDDFSLTGKQRDELRDDLLRIERFSLLETLRALNLGATLPAIGERIIVPLTADKAPFPDIKTIAIASAIGDKLDLAHEGFFVWTFTHDSVAIGDWQIDQHIEEQTRAILSTRFAVKDVPIDRTGLLQAHLLDDKNQFNPVFTGLNTTQDVDAYLVFIKFPRSLRSNSNFGNGVGVHNVHVPDYTHTDVFAYYAIALIDAHTLKLIRLRVSAPSPRYPDTRPYKIIDNAFWSDTPETLPPDKLQAIHDALSEVITDSVAETLLRMGLTDKIIVDTPPLSQSDNGATPAEATTTQ